MAPRANPIVRFLPPVAVAGGHHHLARGHLHRQDAETFGIVALEAMFKGKPIIAARSGGLPDVVVDGETGFLVPPGDFQALGQAMKCLLDDPERRAHMGVRARQRAAEFQAKTVVSRFEAVYQELLGVSLTEAGSLAETGRR